jgi:hypothetical protein
MLVAFDDYDLLAIARENLGQRGSSERLDPYGLVGTLAVSSVCGNKGDVV